MPANAGRSALWPGMDETTLTRMTGADMIHRLWQRTNFTRAGLALCASAALTGCSEKPAAPAPAARAELRAVESAELMPVTVAPALRYPAEILAAEGNLRLVSLEFPAPPIPKSDAAQTIASDPRASLAELDIAPVPPPDEAVVVGPSRLPPPTVPSDARVEAERLVRTPPVEEYAQEYADATVVSAIPAAEVDFSERPRSRWSDEEPEQSHEQGQGESLRGWTFRPQPLEQQTETAATAEPAYEAPVLSMPIFEPTPVERGEQFHEEQSVVVGETVRRLPLVVEQPVSVAVDETLVAAPSVVEATTDTGPRAPYIVPNPEAIAAARRADAMRGVNVRTEAIIRHAFGLAHRGAEYSARAELVESLRMISQALDMESGDSRHSEALARAFRAMEEAEDFIPRGTSLEANLNMAILARGHKTPVLKSEDPSTITPIIALQRYYTYAQEQLIIAGGHERNASVALYGLGRLESVMDKQSVGGISRGAPKAMVFHQAAMLVDEGNYKAANELGVLLARYGQYDQAREVLVHSVRVSPQPQSWRNLATVHERLEQHDLARRATYESQLAAADQPASGNYADALVRWVEPDALAAATGDETYIPAPLQPAATPETSRTTATPASDRGESRGLMRLIPWIRSE